jgi:phosphoenolpyruvate carboxylase
MGRGAHPGNLRQRLRYVLSDETRRRFTDNGLALKNVVAGLGAAAGSERERFIELAGQSTRLRSLLGMVARGKQLSSLNAVAANAMVFDPGFWTWRGAWGREPQLEAACRTLAGHLLEDDRAGSINRLVHHLRLDAVELHGILEAIGFEGGKVPDDERLQLDLLQALRLALIFRVFILSAQLPRFATRNDISHEQILRQALALEIPEVLVFIRRFFPHRAELCDDARFD